MSQRKKKRFARRILRNNPRSPRIETLESRIVMSADPFLGPLLGHHAINDAPSLDHHDAGGFGGGLGHAIVESAPVYDAGADFWLNSDIVLDDDDLGEQIDQTLYDAHGLTGQDDMVSKYGFDGTGQTVVVIDSGIAYNHYALGGGLGSDYRVVGGWDFTESDADPYDDGPEGAHGTHVAGIIGAQGDGQHSGVATGVDLVGLRVFDDAGNGYFSWVEQALAWVHTNKDSFENSITAVNLSLGTDWNAASVPSWAMLEDEFAALESDGIFISVSAGNSFTSYNVQGLSYPAASSHVIPVMSVDNDGSLSYFSQRATDAIAAPGRWITSTVPDYAANDADTIDDDWLSMSGTSMAAPYMAGASVLVRQAMEFVGQTGIDQWDIYDHMMATADSFYDSATNATYKRLNLEAAIDALMPTDDYGSTIETAHDLGTIYDTSGSTPLSLMTGAITTLADADYFTFTAGATGTMTFNTASASHDMVSEWAGWGGEWTVGADGYSIDVIAGQSYSVALSSSDGLGYYDLDFSLESSFSFIDLGAVSPQETRAGLAVSGEQWYSFTAGQSGYFTVESLPQVGAAQVDLYDASQNLLANDIGSGRADAIVSSGDTIYVRVTGDSADLDLRLTNAVAISGASVTLTGTSGDDTIEFHADAANHTASLNDVWYTFDAATETTFTINGGGSAGNDSITLVGTSGDELAVLYSNSATLTGDGFSVNVTTVETIVAQGGGGTDRANFYDSAGDDRFIGRSTYAQMSGTGYFNLASDFDLVYAYATSGGADDRADFYDSAGDDRFVGKSTYAQMSGTGFFNYASGFDRVYAYATAGGADDRADFYDSAGDDRFVGKSTYSQMSGTGFFNYASGFDRVYAYATAGGADDRADFYDSAGDDRFIGKSTHAQMSGTGYFNYGVGFDRVYAYATAGGADDRADFYDSAGDDRFVAKSDYAQMSGTGFFNYGGGFDRVYAYATAGGADDRADFYDSAGNDRFIAKSTFAQMSGTGFFNYGSGFDRTYAYATAGGSDDRADFYDSAGDDRFFAWSNYSQMLGDGFFNYGAGFDRVYAYATAGGANDRAYFFGSEGDDRFDGRSVYAQMSGTGFFNYASGFDRVHASAGADGGYDRAYLFDTAGDDTLVADDTLTELSGVDYYLSTAGFDGQVAYSLLGGNDTSDVDIIDSVFSEIGDWTV